MKNLLQSILGFKGKPLNNNLTTDYLKSAIHLDAKVLCKFGMSGVYDLLIPKMKKLGIKPLQLKDHFNANGAFHSVSVDGKLIIVFDIEESEEDDEEGRKELWWSRATPIFFQLVNFQLESISVRFYALYGGNDLHGIFLTQAEFEEMAEGAERPDDRPYIPNDIPPWFGQPHR